MSLNLIWTNFFSNKPKSDEESSIIPKIIPFMCAAANCLGIHQITKALLSAVFGLNLTATPVSQPCIAFSASCTNFSRSIWLSQASSSNNLTAWNMPFWRLGTKELLSFCSLKSRYSIIPPGVPGPATFGLMDIFSSNFCVTQPPNPNWNSPLCARCMLTHWEVNAPENSSGSTSLSLTSCAFQGLVGPGFSALDAKPVSCHAVIWTEAWNSSSKLGVHEWQKIVEIFLLAVSLCGKKSFNFFGRTILVASTEHWNFDKVHVALLILLSF